MYALFVLPAFLSVQFFPILQGSGPGNDYLKIYTQEIQDISKAVALPRDDFVISNRDELIRIFRKRNVRYLDFLETVTPEELAHKVTKHRGLTVVLFRHAIEDYPQWRQVFSGDIPPGYRSVHSSENMVILMHNKTRTGSHRKGRARVSGRSPVSLLLYACCCPGW